MTSSDNEWNSLLLSNVFEMVPVSQLFTHRSTETDSTIHEPLSVGKLGVTPQLDNIIKSEKTSGRKLVKKGDVVINSRADRRGASGLADRDGSVSLIYIVLEPKTDLIVPEYAHHLIRSVAFQEEFFRYGTGIHDDLWSTRYDRMAQIRVPIPPLETQKRIADHLSRETLEVDAAINELTDLKDLLAKRREALITEVVTGRKQV